MSAGDYTAHNSELTTWTGTRRDVHVVNSRNVMRNILFGNAVREESMLSGTVDINGDKYNFEFKEGILEIFGYA